MDSPQAIAGGIVAGAYPLGVSAFDLYSSEPKNPNWKSMSSGIATQGIMVQSEPTPIGTGTISATQVAPSSYEMLINGGAEPTAYEPPPEGMAIYPAAGNLGALYWTNDYYLNLGQAGTGKVIFAANPASVEQASGNIYDIIYNTASSRAGVLQPQPLVIENPLTNPITVSPATYTTRNFIARVNVSGKPNVATSPLGSVNRWFQNTFGVQTSATALGEGSSQYAVAENGASMSISQNPGPASQAVGMNGQAFVQYESTTWIDRIFGTSSLYTTEEMPIVTSVGSYLSPGAPIQTLVTTAGMPNSETLTEGGKDMQMTISPDGRPSFKSTSGTTIIVSQDTGVVRIGQYVGKSGVLSGGQFSITYDMAEVDKNIGIATTSEPWLDKLLETPTSMNIDVNAGGGITNGYGQTVMSGAIVGNPQSSSYSGGLQSIFETPPSATGFLLNFASASSPTETLQETFKMPSVDLNKPRGMSGYIYTLQNQGYPSGVTVQQGDVSQFSAPPQKMSLFTGGAQSALPYTFISFPGQDLPPVSALMAPFYTPPPAVAQPSVPESAWTTSYFNIGTGEGGISGSFNPFANGVLEGSLITLSEGGQIVTTAEMPNIVSTKNIYPSWGTSPATTSVTQPAQPVYTDELADALKNAQDYAGKFGYTCGETPATPNFVGTVSGYEIFGASQPTVAAPIAQVSGGTDELADSLKNAEGYAGKFGYTVGETPATPNFVTTVSGYEIFGASQPTVAAPIAQVSGGTDELADSLKNAEGYAGKFGYTVGETPATPNFVGTVSGYEIFGASQPTVAAPIAQVSGGTDELADSLKIAEEYAGKFGYTVGETPATPNFVGTVSG